MVRVSMALAVLLTIAAQASAQTVSAITHVTVIDGRISLNCTGEPKQLVHGCYAQKRHNETGIPSPATLNAV